MRLFLSLFIFCLLTTSAMADRFQSKIHEIVDGPTVLIKFDNGRVGFLSKKHHWMYEALKESMTSRDLGEFDLNRNLELKAAWTVSKGTGSRMFEGREVQRMSYDPTIISSLSKARSIFYRMTRGGQNDSQCYNRAHVWAYEEFHRSGLNSMKLFLFFTNRYIRNYRYKWWFHVSPMAMVKIGSKAIPKVLDRRYTGGPRNIKTWTNNFIYSRRSCPIVYKYSDYDHHQESEDCYLMPVSMYFWQPRDIEFRNVKTSFIQWEIDWAYDEAF